MMGVEVLSDRIRAIAVTASTALAPADLPALLRVGELPVDLQPVVSPP